MKFNFLDLIKISVMQPFPGQWQVQVDPIDPRKQFVIDTDAKNVLEQKVVERCREYDTFDPKVRTYIEEFVARMIEELEKRGMCLLEDAKDPHSDPYNGLR